MEIRINGTPKEIADFVSDLQNRHKRTVDYGIIEHFDNILKQKGTPCPKGAPGEIGIPMSREEFLAKCSKNGDSTVNEQIETAINRISDSERRVEHE
ncbi:MAG: hypothetical protein K2N36_05970 [Ruminiclostridium sp.]|nr:hypothetical protein [Ruminiclostridium sp.]